MDLESKFEKDLKKKEGEIIQTCSEQIKNLDLKNLELMQKNENLRQELTQLLKNLELKEKTIVALEEKKVENLVKHKEEVIIFREI